MDRRAFAAGLIGALATPNIASAHHLYIGTPHHVHGWSAQYFSPREFASRGNSQVQVTKALVANLDVVRSKLGRRMDITSGYRDEAWNRFVGGAPGSRHLISDAVEISLSGYNPSQRYQLATLLIQHGFTSFGTYSHLRILHADRRPKATSWHYGGGQRPEWLTRAMRDTGWKRGSGVN